MKILALDTATEACSAALEVDGEIRERYAVEPRAHGRLLLPMAEELLAEAGVAVARLDTLAFGCGPGAFTGLRIAAGVVQGLAFGADLPVVAVSDLRIVAQGAVIRDGAGQIAVAMDARMSEVYWGTFEAREGLATPVGEECVTAPGSVPVPEGQGWLGVGTGWSAYREALEGAVGDRVGVLDAERLPRASDMLAPAREAFRAGRAVAPDQAVPVYLRNTVAG